MRVSIRSRIRPTGLKDGTHAFQLTQELKGRIGDRSAEERRGTLHLLAAAPNAFIFFLAQQARTFGRTVLYEHWLGSGKVGHYYPSLTFPPPE